ncbi:MAG: replicative DNA helicase [Desulfovibrionales bacterium]
MVDTQTAPHSLETEQSVIAATILAAELGQPQTTTDIFDRIDPAEFYRGAHQQIMEAARDLHRTGDPLDLISLSEALKARGALEKVGGASYLAQICNTAPVPSSVKHYCRTIREKANLRRLIQACQRTIQAAHQGRDAAEVLDTAQAEILKIDTGGQTHATPIDSMLDEALDRYERLHKMQGQLSGMPSGFPDIDLLTAGFQPSDLIILAARPSMGKSALVVCMMAYMGLHDWPCGAFSLEMSKEQIMDRITAVTGRVNSIKFRNGRFQDQDWLAITNTFGKLAKKPIYIDDSSDARFSSIRKRARQMVKQGVRIIFVDYLQLIAGSNQTNRNLEISEITRGFKLLAKDLNVPIVLLSQLSRKCEERNRNDKRPLLSDLRDSGAIEQDADVVLFLFREEVYHPTDENRGRSELIVAKQRNGPTGAIELQWNAATTRFDSYFSAEIGE